MFASPAKITPALGQVELRSVLSSVKKNASEEPVFTPDHVERWPDDLDAKTLLQAEATSSWPEIYEVLGESGINLRAAQKLALKAMVNSSAVKLVRQEERSKEDAAADSNRGHGEGQSERTLCKKRDRPRGRDGRPRGPNPRPGTEVLTIPVVPARRAAMMESSCDIGAVINERTAPASRWLATKALRNDVFASVGLKKKETDTEKGFVELHVSSAQQACFLPVVQDTTVLALDPSTGSRLDGGAPLALARELSSLMSTICDTAQHNALKDALAVDDELATLPPLLFGIELQATNGSLEIERFNFDITPPAAWGTELSFALMNQAIIADEVVGRYYATDAARGVRQCEAEAREENRSKANFPVCSFPGLHERQSEHENECAVLIVHNAASAADEQRIVLIHNAFVAMDVHVGVIGLRRCVEASDDSEEASGEIETASDESEEASGESEKGSDESQKASDVEMPSALVEYDESDKEDDGSDGEESTERARGEGGAESANNSFDMSWVEYLGGSLDQIVIDVTLCEPETLREIAIHLAPLERRGVCISPRSAMVEAMVNYKKDSVLSLPSIFAPERTRDGARVHAFFVGQSLVALEVRTSMPPPRLAPLAKAPCSSDDVCCAHRQSSALQMSCLRLAAC
jgi:hypothetical protein